MIYFLRVVLCCYYFEIHCFVSYGIAAERDDRRVVDGDAGGCVSIFAICAGGRHLNRVSACSGVFVHRLSLTAGGSIAEIPFKRLVTVSQGVLKSLVGSNTRFARNINVLRRSRQRQRHSGQYYVKTLHFQKCINNLQT